MEKNGGISDCAVRFRHMLVGPDPALNLIPLKIE
jgi:hypothetical protein